MAINLRTLLSKKDALDVHPNDDNLLPRFPLEGYTTLYVLSHGCQWRTADSMAGTATNYHYNYYPQWEIPAGTTDVIFELWGGGGAGAGNCCCHSGPPGSSGAYAAKRLTGNQVVPGCTYELCVAPGSDRASGCSGRRGCTTFIIGHNLASLANCGFDFCAEGGHGGNGSYCYGCCADQTNLIRPRHLCCDANGNPECRDGCCALYFGADWGAYGVPSFYTPTSTGERCCNSIGFAYPGGLINSKGGWIHFPHRCQGRSCSMCEQRDAAGLVGVGGSYCMSYVPGMGGATAYNCENDVYCGGPGAPGMIRISYK